MYKLLAFICTLIILGHLKAEPHTSLGNQTPSVITEVAPYAYVFDMVNAVDGTLYLKLPHISVPGHIPLDLVQYYTNKSDYSSWFGSGMSLNICTL